MKEHKVLKEKRISTGVKCAVLCICKKDADNGDGVEETTSHVSLVAE